MQFQNVCLESFGYTLPEEIVTSDDIEHRLEPLYSRLRLPQGRLELMTGISQRRDRFRLLATRVAIPVFGIIAVYVALEVRVVYDLIQDANSVILVCVTVPFITGVWWKRANRIGALASMAMGFLTWFVAILLAPEFPGDLLGLLIGLLTILVVTPLTQKIDPPVPLRNGDGEEVEFKDRLGTLPLFRAASK